MNQTRTFNSLNSHFFINNVGLMNQTPTDKTIGCGYDESKPLPVHFLFQPAELDA